MTQTRVGMLLAAVGVAGMLGVSPATAVAVREQRQATVDAPSETVRKVRQALERLPYYGVFDFLAFSVRDGVVTLRGYAHRAALKKEAEQMVRKATGAEVANQIEILPASTFDDDLRWETYVRVYSGDFASRYVAGGASQILYSALDMAKFPGMEPYENYPVHIIVKDRKITLVGAVDNDFDKTQLFIRASGVPHALAVDDAVMVRQLATGGKLR